MALTDFVDTVAIPVPKMEEASQEKCISEHATNTTPVSSEVPIGEFSQTWMQDMRDAFDSLPGGIPLFSPTQFDFVGCSQFVLHIGMSDYID